MVIYGYQFWHWVDLKVYLYPESVNIVFKSAQTIFEIAPLASQTFRKTKNFKKYASRYGRKSEKVHVSIHPST